MDAVFDRRVCRIKARTWPMGAARSRLFLVLRQLSLCRDEIVARLQSEQRLEIDRRLRIEAEVEASRWVEQARASRLLREARVFERMGEEQRAALRMEEEIVEWING
jgi:hypothetical protein